MVNPLQYITSRPHPLGQEIDLEFTVPAIPPSTYSVYIFKKEGTDITNTEIDDYFAGSTPSGLTVFELHYDGAGIPHYMDDLACENDKTYYYKGVVQDKSNSDYSSAIGTNSTATINVTTSIVDAKDQVVKLLKRILSNYNMDEIKHYQLFREYGLQTDKTPVFYIVRAGGSVVQRFIGAFLQQNNGNASYGEIDMDVIQVMWEDPSTLRRDKITNIFRESREAMRQYLLHPRGGKMVWVDISLEGDAINSTVQDRIQVTGMMTIACGIESDSQFDPDLASWTEATMQPQE